jgi:hypothetical protein
MVTLTVAFDAFPFTSRGGTADTNGSQPLSAYFIGLLGFLSGLMYDEAFGRVRRVGTGMFSAKPGEEAVNARAEDRSLADALRARAPPWRQVSSSNTASGPESVSKASSRC